MQICDEYVNFNFDSKIFQNLGTQFKESIAEIIAVIIDGRGLGIDAFGYNEMDFSRGSKKVDAVKIFKKVASEVQKNYNN